MEVNVSAASHFVGGDREMTAAQEENGMKVDDLSDSDDSAAIWELNAREKLSHFEVELIRYMEDEDFDGLRNWLKSLPQDDSISIPFKSILHYIDVQDEENFIRAIIQALSTDEHPLHKLASRGAFRLTALFLEHGVDPNIRAPIVLGIFHEEFMLPLCVALHSLTFNWVNLRCAFDNDNAAVRLVSYMCSASRMDRLETARLLASKTKEIDQVISNYMMQGCVQELCVLMLLGYHSQVSSLVYCCCDESPSKEIIEQLVDIFERIGEKLVYYVKLQGLKGVNDDRVIIDVALLLNDAGYQVTSKDILPRQGKHRHFFYRPFMRKSCSGIGHCSGDLCYSIVRVFRDFIRGYRNLDVSSISEAHEFVKSSYLSNNTVKPALHRCPPFLFKVLWRATKFS